MSQIPAKIFVNVYQPFAGAIGTAYATRQLADQMAARGRLACIEVDTGTNIIPPAEASPEATQCD